MNWWPWKSQPKEPTPTLATSPMASVSLTWEVVQAGPLPDPTVGVCIFCNNKVLCTEEHLVLKKIGSVTQVFDDVYACHGCGVREGWKW